MGVSKNRGTPKSSILIGFSIINHPFWGIPIFGNTHMKLIPRFGPASNQQNRKPQEMKLKELKNGRLAASFYAADCVLGGNFRGVLFCFVFFFWWVVRVELG